MGRLAEKQSAPRTQDVWPSLRDPHEREADRAAEQVMQGSRPSIARACGCGGGCAGCNSRLQKKSATSDSRSTAVPAGVNHVLQSSGQPLAHADRTFMESRFGHDFSDVRIHADDAASSSARALRAQAYTVGQSIVFGPGRYAPGAHEGRELLAHELAHVVQQQSGAQTPALQMRPERKEPKEAPKVDKAAQEAIALIEEIEEHWGSLAAIAKRHVVLAPWVMHGEKVVRMIREHALGSLAARDAKDGSLEGAYQSAVETDKITYDYIAWHLTVYVNLLSIRSSINKLVDAFDHDSRAFTNRAEAESLARQFKKASDGLEAHSQQELQFINTSLPYPAIPSITVTSPAADPKVAEFFRSRTSAMRDLQINLQRGGDVINQFVDTAFQEGLQQVPEVLVEYAIARAGVRKPKQEKQKNQKPKEETKPLTTPVPLVPVDDEDKKKCRGKTPCEMPLPIRWPKIMPLPQSSRPLVRTPHGDPYIPPEKRSKPQRELQKEIAEARQKNVPPPQPCFADDAEPNAPYDAHHMQPLFLGGAEDRVNLCSLRADFHQAAHPRLNNQADMLGNAIWVSCKMCEGQIPRHPAGQEYEISGRK